jgi:hypothetical protein
MTRTNDAQRRLGLSVVGLLVCGCASTGTPAQIEPEPPTTSTDSSRTSVESPRVPPLESVAPSEPTVIGSGAEEGAPPSCEDTTRVQRAVTVALERARAEGVEAALIADCDPAAARCGGQRDDSMEPEARCAVQLQVGDGRHEVRITPAARTGAPIDLEVWVDAQAREAGFFHVAATQWAVSTVRRVFVRGVPRTRSHTHGGDPAQIGHASFLVTHRGDRALPIRLVRVEWLDTGRVVDVSQGASLSTESLPPGTSTELEVSFSAQPAYAAFHERFATRVVFEVGGETLTAPVEQHVIRREPLER